MTDDNLEKKVLEAWLPKDNHDRFEQFKKAGFDWKTGNNIGQEHRAEASEYRRKGNKGMMDTNLSLAETSEKNYGDSAIFEPDYGANNTGNGTLYYGDKDSAEHYTRPDTRAPIADDQQNNIAEAIEDNNYNWDDFITKLTPEMKEAIMDKFYYQAYAPGYSPEAREQAEKDGLDVNTYHPSPLPHRSTDEAESINTQRLNGKKSQGYGIGGDTSDKDGDE